jgi:hypothetical protein
MADVTQARLVTARTAEQLLIAARGTERYSLREPDDARLDQMLKRVSELVQTLEADCPRWVAADLTGRARLRAGN